MKKSIISNERECFICGTTQNLHVHHIFFGVSNRKLSDKHGMWVYLCLEHHTGNTGVHRNRLADLNLKMRAQAEFEKDHTREEFRQIFGKSYL